MATFEIPLSPTPQKFRITLSGVEYVVTVRWAAAMDGAWVIDIDDASDNPILHGVPLVPGADLLEQYEYLNFNGRLAVATDYDINLPPTFDNLGVGSHLYFVTS